MTGDSTAALPPKTDNSSLVRIGKLDHQNKEVHSPTQKSRSPTTRRRNPSATDLAPVAPDNCHSQPHNGDSTTGQLNDKKDLFAAKYKHHYQSLTELDRISRPSSPYAETPLINMQPTTAAFMPPKMSSETQTTSCASANASEGPTIESNTFLESLGRLTLEEQDSVDGVGGASSSQTELRDPPNSVDTPSSTGKPNQNQARVAWSRYFKLKTGRQDSLQFGLYQHKSLKLRFRQIGLITCWRTPRKQKQRQEEKMR